MWREILAWIPAGILFLAALVFLKALGRFRRRDPQADERESAEFLDEYYRNRRPRA